MFIRLPLFYGRSFGPTDVAPPAQAAPTTPPASPPPSPPAALDPLAYNAEGVLYKDLLNGTRGGIESLKSQHTATLATIQGQVDAHRATIQERDATITQLQADAQEQVAGMAALTEQVQTIPELMQRAAYADKLEIFTQFPSLVAAQIAQEVQGEDGAEPTTVTVNPYLQLIATTTLNGDPLRDQLSQLSNALPVPSAAVSNAPVIPTPPTPAAPTTRASTLEEIGKRMRANPSDPRIQKEWTEALQLPKAMGGTQ